MNENAASNSVYRAANILIALSNGFDTVNSIANSTDLSMSTVHRLLKNLEQSHLVVGDSIKHRYYLGPLISKLASNTVTAHRLLIAYANEEMVRLSEVSEETVILNIAVGTQAIMLQEIQSKHILRVAFDTKYIGSLVPTGATPKVLLSQYDDEGVRAVIRNASQSGISSISMNETQLLAELKSIREQGYCIHYGERIEGAIAISAPIMNYIFPVCLSVVGYGNRALPKVSQIVEELKKSVSIVSKRLGGYFHDNVE
ncbi:MAG: helix-turn-helix domain-containing protein [Dehalococcoidales bacterium]|nr:helix-turn-helix domain-containing protein [Dehalococcoidales bacterium]